MSHLFGNHIVGFLMTHMMLHDIHQENMSMKSIPHFYIEKNWVYRGIIFSYY